MDARMVGSVGPCLQTSLPMPAGPAIVRAHRRSDSCAAKPQVSTAPCRVHSVQSSFQQMGRYSSAHRSRQALIMCASGHREPIQGYTPANYISFTEDAGHRCHHALAIEVQAPPSVCFGLWNDWCRLVEFMDLVAQIGLDPTEPQLGLFQCFYRWGRMPVMEIVFLAEKVQVETDKLIAFQTVWGMPAAGEVSFTPSESGDSTTVMFQLQHQLPWLLVDLKVGPLAVEAQLREIFGENLEAFKELAESTAREGGWTPPAGTSQPGAHPQQPSEQAGSNGDGAGQPSSTHRNASSPPPATPPPSDSLGSGDTAASSARSKPGRKSSSTSRTGATKSSSKSRGRSKQPNSA